MTRRNDVKWGVTRGLIFGSLYASVAVAIYLLGGAEPFASNGTTFGRTLLLYIIGGFVGGGVLGMLRPLLQEKSTATFVAVLAATPVSFGVTILTTGKLWNWSGAEWFVFIVLALFIGIAGTQIFWGKMGA